MNTSRLLIITVLLAISIISIQCQRSLSIEKTDKPLDMAIPINVKIDTSLFGLGACEPSIAISPANKDIMVAGSILDRSYHSHDGGKTWTKQHLSSPMGVYGDPVIEADFEGNFYYAHLSNPTGRAWQDEEFLDRIVVQKSSDGGLSWTAGNYPAPNPPKDQDKEWMAADPITNDIVMTWTEFDKYNSKDPDDQSRIVFSRYSKKSDKWSDPIAISEQSGDCLDGDNTTEGAVPAFDNNGNIYVAWANDYKIFFDKSSDGGKTWLDKDITVTNQPGGWDLTIPGINRCNGMPVTKVDLSDSPYSNNIYINWTDQRNGEDDTDVWIVKSTDGGDSWTAPLRVNDDPAGKHQFFTWMDVDPVTGYIYIVFYDRRAYNDETTDVYLATSIDGGASFTNKRINEESFKPNELIFFGDYNDISAYDGRVRPIWTTLNKAKLSVYTALIEHK